MQLYPCASEELYSSVNLWLDWIQSMKLQVLYKLSPNMTLLLIQVFDKSELIFHFHGVIVCTIRHRRFEDDIFVVSPVKLDLHFHLLHLCEFILWWSLTGTFMAFFLLAGLSVGSVLAYVLVPLTQLTDTHKCNTNVTAEFNCTQQNTSLARFINLQF